MILSHMGSLERFQKKLQTFLVRKRAKKWRGTEWGSMGVFERHANTDVIPGLVPGIQGPQALVLSGYEGAAGQQVAL